MIPLHSRIFIAGHNGLVGSALVRAYTKAGYSNILTRSRSELDLSDAHAVRAFFDTERPEYVVLAAAKVGGIVANSTYPADFIRENLAVQLAVIDAAFQTGVTKLLFLGSSCIYPKMAAQPIIEDSLLTGPLEPTNQAYAIAKIAGIELCRSYRTQYGANFISVMPTNLYGPNDNFHPENSHVLPGLMRRFHEAKKTNAPEVVIWGTGSPRREFLHVDDLAEACLFLMNHYGSGDIINIGTGEDISIKELAETIQIVIGYEGALTWDHTKPDGTPRKLLNVSKLHTLGWKHKIELRAGISETYAWYTKSLNTR